MSNLFDDELLRRAAARRTLLGSLLGPSLPPAPKTRSPLEDALAALAPPLPPAPKARSPLEDALAALAPPLPPAPKTRSPLEDALAALSPPPKPALPPTQRDSIGGLLASPYPQPANTRPLGGLFEPSPPKHTLSGLFGLAGSRSPALPVNREPVRRKAFFSFHYADIMRVNNVRQEGKIHKRATERNFYDASLWESKRLEGPDALKKLIREGMEGASVVCVLIGSETWLRRWVKYEIARALIEQKGLFGVHINGLKHHQRRRADAYGFNPFHHMGVYKDANGKFYLGEKRLVLANAFTGQKEWRWQRYADHVGAVPLPRYLPEPQINWIMPLSEAVEVYDYCHPQRDLGAWIDRAAVRAGRK